MKTSTFLLDIANHFLAKMEAPVRRKETVTLALALQVILDRTAVPLSLAASTTPAKMEPPAMSVEVDMCAPAYLDMVATTASSCYLRFPEVSLLWIIRIADIQRT